MLLTIAVILIIAWLLGFTMHIAGGLIHIVLVIAVVMFILHMVRGRGV
ncbi:MAG: lmo0937 family membrane protein [Chthoniobacterales bacterium]